MHVYCMSWCRSCGDRDASWHAFIGGNTLLHMLTCDHVRSGYGLQDSIDSWQRLPKTFANQTACRGRSAG